MTQEAVESLLGRLITDREFRILVDASLEKSCREAGYSLNPEELSLMSGSLDLQRISELGNMLDPGLCRAGFVISE